MDVGAKCSDMCSVSFGDMERNDYAPQNLNIGGGDYIEFEVCLDCGRMQGEFPIDDETVEENLT